jgi:regulator of protease activity HflC (stomatin/prohibitin superfamily)
MRFLKYLIVAMLAFSIIGCSKVPAGHVGVKYYLLGSSKGVDSEELGPGRYYVGWNEELYLFPTYTQNYVWTLSSDKGSPNDESIGFQTREGLTVSADIGISYAIVPDRVTDIFQKYRRGIDEITDLYLRNMVRDALVKSASTRSIESVYGSGKTDLIAEVEKEVRGQVEQLGINIERVYWIGELRLPQNVVNAINAKIQATQMAEQRRNEVEQAKAEAEKVRMTSQGQADAQLMLAKAEAEAIEIKGQALRQNSNLVQLMWVEKWDGKMPIYQMGGATPLIQVPSAPSQ